MRIKKIIIENFRGFYGRKELELIYCDKAINLIIAENEVGKTSILNAMLWCLYGKLTEDSESQELIFNKNAKKEKKEFCHVEIHLVTGDKYDDENPDFIKIVRRLMFSGKEILRAQKVDGITEDADDISPSIAVHNFVPEALAPYFFFDGEGIHRVVDNPKLLENAVLNIQGLDNASDAYSDLERFKVKKNQQLVKNKNTSKKLKAINTKIEGFDKKVKENNQKISSDQVIFQENEAEIRKLKALLPELGSDKANQLQKDKDKFQNEVAGFKKRLDFWLVKEKEIIKDYSLAITGYNHFNKADKWIIDKGKTTGIPSGYQDIFVKNTLSSGVCICGEKFKVGDKKYKKIECMFKDAQTDELKTQLKDIQEQKTFYSNQISKFNDAVNEVMSQINYFDKKINETKIEIAQIDDQLEAIDDNKIKELINKLKDLESENGDIQFKKIRFETINQTHTDNINRLKKERKGLEGDNEYLEYDNAVLEFLDESMAYLNQKIIDEKINGKEMIAQTMNNFLDRYSRGNNSFRFDGDSYRPVIYDSAYSEELDISDSSDISILSKGGAAVKRNIYFALALSKISSNRSNQNSKDEFQIPGKKAPLFVDAPFSNLDQTNTENMFNLLIENTSQLIILISTGSFNLGIEKILNKKDNKTRSKLSYLVRSYKGTNTGINSAEKRSLETPITINNKVIKTSIYDQDIETTDIIEVK